MLLKRTIAQLDIGHVSDEQAQLMGHLGYVQWLGALPGKADYCKEAQHAFAQARPFVSSSPAIAVFCELLQASLQRPLTPLNIVLPVPARRGGARARRKVF